MSEPSAIAEEAAQGMAGAVLAIEASRQLIASDPDEADRVLAAAADDLSRAVASLQAAISARGTDGATTYHQPHARPARREPGPRGVPRSPRDPGADARGARGR